MSDVLGPAANEEQVKEQKARSKRADKQAVADLKAVMGSAEGRRFVWRQLELAGCYRMSFAPGQPDVTAFNEGMRDRGNQLLGELLLHCPDLYAAMTTEHAERERNG